MPFTSKVEGMLPGPASYVQDRSCYLPPPDQVNELLLGPADVPGGVPWYAESKKSIPHHSSWNVYQYFFRAPTGYLGHPLNPVAIFQGERHFLIRLPG